MPKVFLSHSHDDTRLAELLTDLLVFSLKLDEDDIRCTSVEGYGLPAGLTVDQQLRLEVLDSETFIGLISHSSLESIYVLFELGARWGTGKPFIPLLAPGVETEELKPPLSGLIGLRCDNSHDLRRLIQDLAAQLGVPTRSPTAYEKYINRILNDIERGSRSNISTTITITRPVNEEMVDCRQLVEGLVDDPKAEVWVIVHPKNDSAYYVQLRATVSHNGRWSTTVYIGREGNEDEGTQFELRAVANPKVLLKNGWIYQGWPTAEAQSDVLEVSRRVVEPERGGRQGGGYGGGGHRERRW